MDIVTFVAIGLLVLLGAIVLLAACGTLLASITYDENDHLYAHQVHEDLRACIERGQSSHHTPFLKKREKIIYGGAQLCGSTLAPSVSTFLTYLFIFLSLPVVFYRLRRRTKKAVLK